MNDKKTTIDTELEGSADASCSADRGLRHHRTEIDDDTGKLEKALAELWVEKNKPDSAINYGNGILQDLCFQTSSAPFGPFSGGTLLHKVSDDERKVVATVIQWLGTNVGRNFLHQAYRNAGWKLAMEPNDQSIRAAQDSEN